jgi:hypothetical protein
MSTAVPDRTETPVNAVALPDLEGALTSLSAIQTGTVFSPMAGPLAFAARIKPEGAPVPAQIHPAPGVKSIGRDDSNVQPVKTAGSTSTKDEDTGNDQRDRSAPPASGSTYAAAKSSSRKDEAESTASPVEPNAAPATQVISQPMSAGVLDQPGLKATPAPDAQSASVPEPAHPLLDKPSETASPARSISLQVEAASGQTVDIRIAARPGDLNVAVRAGDDDMAQNLRQGLGDLESRLAQSGYHAETWHPGHSGSTTEPAAPASNSSNSSSQQQSQSGSGWSQQNRGQRDNNPSNRPRWVNQLASTLKADSKEKGNANGIAN